MSRVPGRIARVVLDLPRRAEFDFLAPADVRSDDLGRVVVVPFGSRKLAGVIVGFADTSEVPAERLKPLHLIQRDWPALSDRELQLFRFCADYYHHALGSVILSALPPRLRTATRFVRPRVRRLALTEAGRLRLSQPGREVALHRLLRDIADGPVDESALKTRHPALAAKLGKLLARGDVEVAAATASPPDPRKGMLGDTPRPTAEQGAAIAAIVATLGRFEAFLLDGVTGSGKTEVYLHAIAAALATGGQALVLLPEIHLTPRFLRYVESRLPAARIAILHSGLAAGDRVARQLEAVEGRADIVIGTRLAVFAPLPRLSLVVIDEEHDTSFKQQEGLRYSARDLGVFRAHQMQCPVIIGSATPSLEALANAARGRYTHLRLAQRANPGAVLPPVDFIDLDRERVVDGLSERLLREVELTLARGEQALVFINRRGFAPVLVCTQCGHMPACDRCSARLVFHRREARLKCHHCGFQSRVPEACAACGSLVVVAVGEGTERVEDALKRRLPAARIARVDREAVRRRGEMERLLDDVAAGGIDVLVGTQMLAKGHDFPRLTLVAVVNADGGMFSGDFRAAERLVALLMQVAGRAGRAERPGRVLIQTRFAAHPFYRAIARHDYAAFAKLALAERQAARLPPFAYLALLRAQGPRLEPVERFLREAHSAAQALLGGAAEGGVDLWDPVAPTLARKAGQERRQLMVQSASRAALQVFLTRWHDRLEELNARGVHWQLDIDPQEV